MRRQLSADERALWRRVTADVRRSGADLSDPPAVDVHPSSRPAPPSPSPSLRRSPAIGAMLDARWDRELRTGLVMPDRVVDLHGCTLAAAHALAVQSISAAWRAGDRVIVLVTGKAPPANTSRLDMPLRGIIRASIGDWLAAHAVAAHIAAIRPAHARHGGNGALYVVLRRAR